MIIIGVGANLEHAEYGAPRRTCGAALAMLESRGIGIIKRSAWYCTAPVLADHGAQGDQPWYVNGAVAVSTSLPPEPLLDVLMGVELEFGRTRSIVNAPRTLDLDIIAYNDEVLDNPNLIVPHPRMGERAFVLHPLREIAPDWRHPVTKTTISVLIRHLPAGQSIDPMPDAEGLFGTEWHR